ncbi:MAG: sulfatase [Myxococcota bacterium]
MRTWTRRLELLFAIAAATALVVALWLPKRPEVPNLLLVTLDTTRADHLGPYGYLRDTTPALDALAARSTVYTAAWAPMATTLPSHTSLMTGVWPLEHGVLANVQHGGRRTLPSDRLVPVAELFRAAGYLTAAFVSATPLKSGTGIERGFATFDQSDRNVRHARHTTDAAIAWLERYGRSPFFAWVHYYDAHGPFAPPPAYATFTADDRLRAWMDERRIPTVASRSGGAELDPIPAHDGYDGELAYVDDQLGRLLAAVAQRGVADRTVVVVVGDHGEGLGQHQVAGHGHVWREQLQVPLVVHVPWRSGGERVDAPIAMVDVMPTVLAELDRSLYDRFVTVASGRAVGTRGSIGPSLGLSSLRQEALGTEQSSLTVGGWRYLDVDGTDRLYDLTTDPHELADLGDLLPVHRAVLARWATAVADAQRARGAALGTGGTTEVPPAELERLERLGYLDEE